MRMLKWTITALYRIAYAERVFGPGGCFAPPKDARKISKILTCRCGADQRGTKADNYDRWRGRRSPLSAAPRATVTYATYDVLSVHTSASRTWRSLPSLPKMSRARFPYHRCRNSNSLSLIKIKETSRAGLLDRVTRRLLGRPVRVYACICAFFGVQPRCCRDPRGPRASHFYLTCHGTIAWDYGPFVTWHSRWSAYALRYGLGRPPRARLEKLYAVFSSGSVPGTGTRRQCSRLRRKHPTLFFLLSR